MLTRIFTATTLGLRPIKIEVEVDSCQGLPNLVLIGLPSKTVDEAKERITTALKNCGIRIRSKRTVVNLAPADLKKDGSAFELAIAVGILKMYGEIKLETDNAMFFGELSLDGRLKPIRGALPLALAARQMGFKRVFFPAANAAEVSLINSIELLPLSHLSQLISYGQGKSQVIPLKSGQRIKPSAFVTDLDMSQIRGQTQAKRALEIAAAGGHNLLMIGPPGAGKTLLAQTLPSILPPLTPEEMIEVTKIYSISGDTQTSLINQRPFRSPHQTISHVGLIGGGHPIRPGEISLAHCGILFMDELMEFPRSCLESLRQPLERGEISITRASGTAVFPANFTLVAATNPCPCGYYQTPGKNCHCTPTERNWYQKKLSGPLMDRIDLFVQIKPVEVGELISNQTKHGLSSAQIRKEVIQARTKQRNRYRRLSAFPLNTNANLPSKVIKTHCQLSSSAQQLLTTAARRLNLSARGYFKVIKVAQTICDLAGEKMIEQQHLAQALQFRNNFNSTVK